MPSRLGVLWRNRKTRAILTVLALQALLFLLLLGSWAWRREVIHETARVSILAALPDAEMDARRESLHTIGALAIQRRPLDPDAYTLLARAQVAGGDDDAAQKTLRGLFALGARVNPAYSPDGSPDEPRALPSMRPFYHRPARMLLTRVKMRAGDMAGALCESEFARSFAQPFAPWEDARPALMHLSQKDYAGALPLTTPGEGDITPVDALGLARAAALAGDWAVCDAWAVLSGVDASLAAESQYWRGRAALARGAVPAARELFAAAITSGYQDAAFFQGVAAENVGDVEAAVVSYLSAPGGSPWWLFGAARALELRASSVLPTPPGGDLNVTALRKAIATVAAGPMPIPQPMHSESGVTPTGMEMKGSGLLLVAWARNQAPFISENTPLSVLLTDASRPLLMADGRAIELRPAEHLLRFPVLVTSGVSPIPPPGWAPLPGEGGAPDTFTAIVGNPGMLRVTAANVGSPARMGSLFIPVEPGARYLFAVHCKSGGAPLLAGWQWFVDEERIVYEHNAINQEIIPEWSWRAEYATTPPGASWVRAVVGIYGGVGDAFFDQAVLLRLDPPEGL